MNRWMARQPGRKMNGWTDSRKDGRTKGRREGRKDRRREGQGGEIAELT